MGFVLPSFAADAVWFHDGGDVYLIEALRKCFAWGGFPFCSYYAAGNEALSWEAKPDWARLIPMLKEGLLEV